MFNRIHFFNPPLTPPRRGTERGQKFYQEKISFVCPTPNPSKEGN